MICNFCWLLSIWFAGASVAENEPAAGGSSLSRFQPLLGSQATISGHLNDFLRPGFVLYFCRKQLWLSWKDFLLDFKESLVLGNSWWCQVAQTCILASLEDCLYGCREQWCSRKLGYNEEERGIYVFCQSLGYHKHILSYVWWSESLMQISEARL